MKCYYCKELCEGLAFQQANFIAVAHRQCAELKINKDNDLRKEQE